MFRSFNRTYVRGVCAIRGHRDLGELQLCSREGAVVLYVSFIFFGCFVGTSFYSGQGVVAVTTLITDSFNFGI